MTNISDYRPGAMFVLPDGRVAYLAQDMRLLDTGDTVGSIPNGNTLPKITDEDAWQWEEDHFQHN